MKIVKNILLSCFLLLNIVGCQASPRCISQKNGHITDVKKIADKSYVPSKGTGTGATVGAGVGATTGAILGGVAGASLTLASFGMAAPLIPALAVQGALIGGAGGGVIGGASGYAYDVHKEGSGLYEYQVKLLEEENNLVVMQNEKTPLAVGSPVAVYIYRNGSMHLKPTECPAL